MNTARTQSSMTPQQARDRDDVHVLDVREDEEWRAGHIAGSHHIPMGEVAERLDELDADQPIVTVCRSGRRSGEVAEALAGHGYDATNLDGGLQAWDRAGLPLTTADGSQGEVA